MRELALFGAPFTPMSGIHHRLPRTAHPVQSIPESVAPTCLVVF
jgi:hypothetical protein